MSLVCDTEVDRGGSRGLALTLDDCICTVCLEIFIEPVTLPCTHTFCKSCFLESVDKSTLCCPLCRKRVSTWVRLNSKKNTLVDQQLWNQIQICFPRQCQRRLSGQDADEEDRLVSVGVPRVSRPGELRQEYEDQVTKLIEEKRAQDETERKASEQLIQRLLTEEEELLQAERRRRDEDEHLARLLSTQLNSQEDHVADVTPNKKKEDFAVGRIDRFLCPCTAQSSSTSSFVSKKENVLLLEAELHVEQPLPYTDKSKLIRSLSVKRKSSELEITEEEEESTTKRVQVPCFPASPSSSLEVEFFPGLEAELHIRRQQEEEDRQLALLLQKELDQEERARATDRRKGSSDAYMLRQKRREMEEMGSCRRGSCKTPRTSGSCYSSSPGSALSLKTSRTLSSSSSRRCSKQMTLTEMFAPCSSSPSVPQTNNQE